MSHDWSSVVIGTKISSGSSTSAKVAGTNTNLKINTSAATNSMRTIDSATEVGVLKQLSPESRQAMVTARVANKWTQVQLNQSCAFPANTIRDMESGHLTPNQKQISILQRILKIQLKLS